MEKEISERAKGCVLIGGEGVERTFDGGEGVEWGSDRCHAGLDAGYDRQDHPTDQTTPHPWHRRARSHPIGECSREEDRFSGIGFDGQTAQPGDVRRPGLQLRASSVARFGYNT